MKTKIITIITSLVAACGLFGLLAPTPALAVSSICDMSDAQVPPEVKKAAGCTQNDRDLTDVIQTIINSVILVLGIVAVIVIVVGGVSYMTSSGDAGKLKKAKDTILYACIGLVICVLSFAITNFVINIISGNTPNTSQNSGSDGTDGADSSNNGSDGSNSGNGNNGNSGNFEGFTNNADGNPTPSR